jgi:hypothetical protein
MLMKIAIMPSDNALVRRLIVQVESRLPELIAKKRYQLEDILGPQFWESGEASHIAMGLAFSKLVRTGRAPFDVAPLSSDRHNTYRFMPWHQASERKKMLSRARRLAMKRREKLYYPIAKKVYMAVIKSPTRPRDGKSLTARQICGKICWEKLSPAERRFAGKFLSGCVRSRTFDLARGEASSSNHQRYRWI